eukprot:TRINITY_DN27782_c0_g1_i2.p1 TRINITY_DN27782_c0_g1~~TRINITY_DN27782_c0_g1_i2.p1  ORF type:complete len:145 (+),score=23.53 TRINITY_DN27782_c0_g1_i2:66-437(+)
MAQCLTGCAKVLGLGASQRRQLALRGDACAETELDNAEMCGDGTAASCSTRASSKATPIRRRDRLRQALFGRRGRAPASDLLRDGSSAASAARKRDWIMVKLGIKKKADALERFAPQDEVNAM